MRAHDPKPEDAVGEVCRIVDSPNASVRKERGDGSTHQRARGPRVSYGANGRNDDGRSGRWAMIRRIFLTVLAVSLCLAASAAAQWTPPKSLTWYWQLQGTPKIQPVQASDFDGFDNSAATVAKFHAAGQKAICYIDVGTWENWRSDAGKFPASVKGATNGWPGERWLDVRQIATLAPIMSARFQ